MKLLIVLMFLSFGCSHVFYQPSKSHYLNPADHKLEFENIYFRTSDGVKLHGWFFPARTKAPKGTLVQFHGNAQNISTHFLTLIWVIEQGYNLFTFDYRGYAKSEGEPFQKGTYKDALAAFDKGLELHQRSGGGKFVVYGQSTGGAIALRALPDWSHYDSVNLTVLDSAFSSYQDIAFDKLRSIWLLAPLSPLAFLLVSDDYAADPVFDQIKMPTLVIVGQKDKVVPQKFGKKIFKHISASQKWLWKLPEGNHIDAYHHAQGRYRKDFIKLLDEI